MQSIAHSRKLLHLRYRAAIYLGIEKPNFGKDDAKNKAAEEPYLSLPGAFHLSCGWVSLPCKHASLPRSGRRFVAFKGVSEQGVNDDISILLLGHTSSSLLLFFSVTELVFASAGDACLSLVSSRRFANKSNIAQEVTSNKRGPRCGSKDVFFVSHFLFSFFSMMNYNNLPFPYRPPICALPLLPF